MRFIINFCLILSAIFSLKTVYADPEDKNPAEPAVTPAATIPPATKKFGIPESQKVAFRARFATAVVQNYTVNVFNPEEIRRPDGRSKIGAGGTGSAVIFEISKENKESKLRGFVVTNHHVVRKSPLDAQKLFLSFFTPSGKIKKIPAKLVKKFSGVDLAILEFDPADLPPGTMLDIAERPSPEEAGIVMSPGRPIIIQGNPMGEIGWTSNGIVASSSSTHEPNMLGIAAPINPGNSGGPIFDEITGWFIGLSTSKISDADGMGFATPVDIIEPLFQSFKYGDPNNFEAYIRLGAQAIPLVALEKRGLLDPVAKAVPDLVKSHKALIIFNEPAAETGLENLDYLLSIDGKIIGSDIGQLYRLVLASTSSHINMKILRGKNILDLSVPLQDIKTELMKRESEFVILGGLFVQDLLPYEVDQYTNGHKGVLVNEILHDTFSQSLLNKGLINTGSLIQSIRIGDSEDIIPINNLNDLKSAVAGLKVGDTIEISVHRSGYFVIPTTGENQPFLDPQAITLSIPVSESVYTNSDFSLEKLKADFPFPQPDLHLLQWRDLAGVSCSSRLKSIGPKAT